MTEELPACMGGFCPCRDRCQLHLKDNRREVSERLCVKGEEVPEPVFIAIKEAA